MGNKELTNLINKMKKCYGVMDYNLAYNEVDLLLNYIEGLQKENEELKQQDKNKDTRNSRQRVSNAYQIIQNDKLKRCFNTQKRRRKEEAQKKKLYKSRIDKAIEYNQEIVDNYLKEDDCEYCDGRYNVAKKNLNILKGDSDDK